VRPSEQLVSGRSPTLAELRRLLRASLVLEPAQKRAWLAVLPHLAPAHRRELLAILELEREDGLRVEG